ncbi:MAG: V-type ATP synthase subunit A [Spirochaetota bacterium]|nr:MAG: V-type ATP synthase subunit A [Spirochaetota bacterium]
MKPGRIVKVAGPLVVADNMTNTKIYDVVRVSEMKLMGEVIEMRGDEASIQVYEETGGLGVGAPVYPTGEALSVELGPGLIEPIYDGVQRPLNIIMDQAGNRITRGIDIPGLSRDAKWDFKPSVKPGDKVEEGDVLGTVQETVLVLHRVMVPPGVRGTVKKIESGEHVVTDRIAVIEDDNGKDIDITMITRWPVRTPRPYKEKVMPTEPLSTGQRVIDAFFPITKGGTACVPGPFGSGKTVVQHQLAKWADAQIIVYVGCGERGNEMTDVLIEFPQLTDPHSGEPLMLRTILIANTSNMPVAAREASVYTGITLAEYYRDMGYSVALMADSTSRWAEAMREMSGRLEEMPGEEGYPAYLGTRIAEFYERAGKVVCLGKDNRIGALSVIGAVSPPGGDLSDPVVQATLRVVRVFWSLEDKLAYRRHFPAISWLTSYSLYVPNLEEYLLKEYGKEWIDNVESALAILQEEAELEEIVRLVGLDALSPDKRLIMETAKSIREDFLHQNAFDDVDTYSSFEKMVKLMELVLLFHSLAEEALNAGVPVVDIALLPERERIARAKFTPEDKLDEFEKIKDEIRKAFKDLKEKVLAEA